MKKHFFIALCILLLFSCQEQLENKYFIQPENIQPDIKISGLELETIKLDSIQSSYVGYSKIINDSIYFTDKMFCKVYKFDKEGVFYNTFLRKGKGPKEIPIGQIQGFTSTDNNEYLFFGASYDISVFNNNWERINTLQINWQINNSRSEMMKNPSPEMTGLYAPSYYKLILRTYNNNLYFPISSQSPNFNFVNSKLYYEQGRILAKMDIKTGKVTKLLGRYSPFYKDYEFLGQFSLINFDITKNGEFYVSYEPDSLIYYYDKDFTIKKVFGFNGRNMNVHYDEVGTINEFQNNLEKQRKLCGFYTYLEYIDERGLLFRNYQKGSHADTNGLQIYKNGIFIGDVDVPVGFKKIIGYIHPYFYSNIIIDEKNENMKIYRFKLNI